MVILYGTLGFHPDKFLGALRGVGSPLERAVVYTGSESNPKAEGRSQRALRRVQATLKSLELPFEHRRFQSPWAFDNIVRTLLLDLQKELPETVVFNLTGGPKTMTVAATIACLVYGIRVFYVPEELDGGGPPVELPLLRIPYSRVLTPKQQRVLRAIEEYSPERLDSLARTLRRKNATVTFHIQRLEKLGAVTLTPHPDDRTQRVPRLTPAGKMMLLAEQILAERQTGGSEAKRTASLKWPMDTPSS